MSPTVWTAQAVADLVGGRLLGEPGRRIDGVATLERAGPTDLAPVGAARYLGQLRRSRVGTVLLAEDLVDGAPTAVTRIVVASPMRALVSILDAFFPPPPLDPGVHASALVAPDAVLGPGCEVGPLAVVEGGARIGARCRLGIGAVVEAGAVIGDDCVLGPRSVCHGGARVGHRVVLKAGAVVSGRGFGFASDQAGHLAIPHVGSCVLEDDVQVGANSCVDRGSIDDTVIGAGTKLDNLVHVGHNVRIGRGCLLMAGVGIGGSCRVGDGVVLAGHVGLVDHVRVGDGARIGAKSGVIGDVPPGGDVSGYPARPHREFLRGQGALYRLPRIITQLEALVSKRGTRGTTDA